MYKQICLSCLPGMRRLAGIDSFTVIFIFCVEQNFHFSFSCTTTVLFAGFVTWLKFGRLKTLHLHSYLIIVIENAKYKLWHGYIFLFKYIATPNPKDEDFPLKEPLALF